MSWKPKVGIPFFENLNIECAGANADSEIVTRHDWDPVHIDCADTTHTFPQIASLLVHHHDFLRASQHDLAPTPLHSLAKKYMFPERIWKDGLDSLMQRVREEGSFEDMLQWLRFCYRYVDELQQAAPGLESDWIQCRMGLDRYFDELAKEMKRCLRLKKCFQSNSRRTPKPCNKDCAHSSMASVAMPFTGVYDSLAHTWNSKSDCHGTGNVIDSQADGYFEPPPWQAGRALTMSSGSRLSEVDSDMTSLLTNSTTSTSVALDNPGHPEFDLSASSESSPVYFDALEWPADAQNPGNIQDPDTSRDGDSSGNILCKSQGDFLALRADVLQGWMVIGQTFNFNTFVKVYVILALHVPGLYQAKLRE